jgi:hypothetical protein
VAGGYVEPLPSLVTMSSAALKCILMLAAYLLAISTEDDKHELALSLLALGQVLLVHDIRGRRPRRRGEYQKGFRRARCDAVLYEDTKVTVKRRGGCTNSQTQPQFFLVVSWYLLRRSPAPDFYSPVLHLHHTHGT